MKSERYSDYQSLPLVYIPDLKKLLYPWRTYTKIDPPVELPSFSQRIRNALGFSKRDVSEMSREQREDYLVANVELLSEENQLLRAALQEAANEMGKYNRLPTFKWRPQGPDPISTCIRAVLTALNFPSYTELPSATQQSIDYELERHGFEDKPFMEDL